MTDKSVYQKKAELVKKLNFLYQAPEVPDDLRIEVNTELEKLVEKLKDSI